MSRLFTLDALMCVGALVAATGAVVGLRLLAFGPGEWLVTTLTVMPHFIFGFWLGRFGG